MPNESDTWGNPPPSCLTDDGLFEYISGRGESQSRNLTENHLAECPNCRRALADLLELLHPHTDHSLKEGSSLSKEELEETLTVIRGVSEKEQRSKKGFSPRLKWAAAAAAAIGFFALSLIISKYIYETYKSKTFFAQARSIVEQGYSGASPSNLRLALPFHSKSTDRKIDGNASLRSAENLFYQALAVQESRVEARLGLAYVYLKLSDFEHSRDEFQKVLNTHDENIQALIGRGAAMYEQAVHGSDPGDRIALLHGALKDFNAALKLNPDSIEARYNKAWTLYESGSPGETLQEIEEYLSRDSDSAWAEALKNLRIKIRATDLNAAEEEIMKAAHLRDREFLEKIAHQAPYQIPPVLWAVMRQSLQLDAASSANERAKSADLRWAAEIMEAAYSSVTGDNGFWALLDFYAGLSPPQRLYKKKLDQNFQALVKLHRDGKFKEVLNSSGLLEDQYATLEDRWQLYNLHHLRGNCLYLGRADYKGAYGEYQKMHEIGRYFNSPYLIAKALVSLARICCEQGKYDESRNYAYTLSDLSGNHNLNNMQAYAHLILGDQFYRLGQLEQSLPEYADALGLSNRLHNESQVIEILENLGEVMGRLDRFQAAKEFLDMALRRLETGVEEGAIPPIPETTTRRLNLIYQLGDLALHTGDLVSAQALFEKSLNAAPEGMREMEARNRIGLAEVYLGGKKLQEAESMLDAALAIGTSGEFPEIEWEARFIKGEIYRENDAYQEALSSYQQSIEVLEGIRESIGPEDLRQSFFTDRFGPYKAVVALLGNTIKNERKALVFVDRAKSKTLREYLSIPEIAASEQSNINKPAIERESASVLEYFFTDDGLLIFMTYGDQVKSASLDLSAAALTPLIRQYLDSIKDNDSKTFPALAGRLYDALIGPIEKFTEFRESETLVILPDGPLHLLPFAGLRGNDGRFLIEQKSLVFAPSRSVLNYCLSLNRPASPGNEPEVLLIDGSAGLSSARDELAYLAKLYGKNIAFVGPRDLPSLGRKAARSGIIHFAGHAVMHEGRPMLLLQTFPDEVYLDSRAIGALKLGQAQLVNLAGCSSGIGPIGEGEAPWGLIPAFLNAGAPSILACYTPVDDAMTEELNRNFYDQLQQRTGKAKALQNAQIALLDSARSNHEINPQSWVPYFLVGNPR